MKRTILRLTAIALVLTLAFSMTGIAFAAEIEPTDSASAQVTLASTAPYVTAYAYNPGYTRISWGGFAAGSVINIKLSNNTTLVVNGSTGYRDVEGTVTVISWWG